MPRPIKDRELTLEEVREWLRLAQTDRLNIFNDRNAIIVWLCRSLLKAWKAAEKEKSND